jgi:hypothetical protein
MTKTTIWLTSPDRKCARRHKKINEALDNPHRKSPPRRDCVVIALRLGHKRAAELLRELEGSGIAL